MSATVSDPLRVVFRCDGDNQLGLGHIYRCAALATILTASHRIRFVTTSDEQAILSLMEKITGDVVVLDRLSDPEAFLQALAPQDVVVLDVPDADAEYQKKVGSLSRSVVCLDDDHQRHFSCDAVINHSPGVTVRDYSKDGHTRLYLGLGYALLRPVFLKPCVVHDVPINLKRLLVCFGATDPNEETERFIKTILPSMSVPPSFISLVVGSGVKQARVTQIIELGLSGGVAVDINQDIDEYQLLHLIKSSDAAVTSASTIALEVISQRKPLYLRQTTADQASNYSFLIDAGAAEEADELPKFSPNRARNMVLVQNSLQGDNVENNLRNIFDQFR